MTNASASLAIPKHPSERRAWVGYRLKLRGLSLRTIARKLGVTHQAVSYALMVPSERIEQALADALELPVSALFPERFDQNGVRIPRTRPDNLIRKRDAEESQNDKDGLTALERVA